MRVERRPRIGLIADYRFVSVGAWSDTEAAVVPASYVSSVSAAGGLPLLIPVDRCYLEDPGAAIALLDGLVLIGGRDLGADVYQHPEHPGNDSRDDLSALRDAVELAVGRAAFDGRVPILGICRGVQLLNVLAGGDLEQHLGDRLELAPHRGRIGEFTRHPVAVTPGTLLAEILPDDVIDVASHHHQGIGRLGSGLRSVATAPDGVIEGVERADGAFCVGVLWHPEQDGDRPSGRAIFEALVQAAAGRVPALDAAA